MLLLFCSMLFYAILFYANLFYSMLSYSYPIPSQRWKCWDKRTSIYNIQVIGESRLESKSIESPYGLGAGVRIQSLQIKIRFWKQL